MASIQKTTRAARKTLVAKVLSNEDESQNEIETQEDELVTVLVPKAFMLTLDVNHEQVHYSAGTQDMPLSHARHWWAVANEVEIYQPATD